VLLEPCDKDIERLMQELSIARCDVSVVDVKDGKKRLDVVG
jgi:hypothetical protein